MKYEEYKANVIAKLKDFYGEDADITVSEVVKNNGTILDGINIRFSKDERIIPVIYLNSFYENEVSVDKCVSQIVEMREGYSNPSFDCDEVYELAKWETVKNKTFPILVSTEANMDILDKYVSRQFLDLSILYVIKVADLGSDSLGTVKITKELFEGYGISEDELHAKSVENLKTEGYKLRDMMDVLVDMLSDDKTVDSEDIINMELESGRMYVLTNKSKMYGAAGILDIALLQSVGASFYILPSSVHETIFVPENADMDQDTLDAMVAEVNATQVSPEEVLSGHSYYYDFYSNEIRIRRCA